MKYDHVNLMLEQIDDPELESVVRQNSTILYLKRKQILNMPGDKLDGLLYITDGLMRYYMMNKEGTEKLLYVLSKGWFFGDICCLLDLPTGLYSQAETDATLLYIPMDTVRVLLAESERFRDALIACLARKLLIVRNEVENLTFLSCKDRIKRLLGAAIDTTHIYDGQWCALRISYTHAELGSIVGASRVTISKVLNEMRNEGFLRTVNQKIQINLNQRLEEGDADANAKSAQPKPD